MILNCKGLLCPMPLIKVKELIERNGTGEYVVLLDNEIAVENLKKFSNDKGYKINIKKNNTNDYKLYIYVDNKSFKLTDLNKSNICVNNDVHNNIIVVFSSDLMGYGDNKLGSILIEGFVFAITQQTVLPTTMIFYNKGVYLTCEGSRILDNLFKLNKLGVSIKTCGTCMDFYGLKDKLAVGEITNMYDIVAIQLNADKILKPY